MKLLAASILAVAMAMVHCNNFPLEICTTCTCYKKFYYEPTFCSTTNGCGEGVTGVPVNVQQVIVDRINMYRKKVAKGEITGIPVAKRMTKISYDDTIAITAQKFTNLCSDKNHDWRLARYDPRGSVGQNGYRYFAVNTDVAQIATDAIDSWFHEVENVTVQAINAYYSSPEPKYPWGHFTQLVAEKSWKVGCGFATSNSKSLTNFYCNFLEAGNLLGGPIYQTGEASSDIGSNCPPGTQREDSLCAPTDQFGPQWPQPASIGRDCSPADSNCATITAGESYSTKLRTYYDDYLHIELQPGQELKFTIGEAHSTDNRVYIVYRYGELVSTSETVVKPKIIFHIAGNNIPLPISSYPVTWTSTNMRLYASFAGYEYKYTIQNNNAVAIYVDVARISERAV